MSNVQTPRCPYCKKEMALKDTLKGALHTVMFFVCKECKAEMPKILEDKPET